MDAQPGSLMCGPKQVPGPPSAVLISRSEPIRERVAKRLPIIETMPTDEESSSEAEQLPL